MDSSDEDGERPANDPSGLEQDPNFLLWLRASLAKIPLIAGTKPAELQEDLLSWYLEDSSLYVSWVPTPAYFGPKHACGSWKVETEIVERDYLLGWKTVRRRNARIHDPAFSTLDEWLRADAAGTLRDPGHPGGKFEMDLPLQDHARLLSASYKRRKSWPQSCPQCGESFRKKVSNQKRCDNCRSREATGKSRRARGSQTTDATLSPTAEGGASSSIAASSIEHRSDRTPEGGPDDPAFRSRQDAPRQMP